MNERLRQFLEVTRSFWGKLTPLRRGILVASVVGTIALVLGVASLGQREHWAYLFTDMTAEDAAAVTAKLKELMVPYRVEAGGTAVQVA